MRDLDPGGFVSGDLRRLFDKGKTVVTYEEVENCGLAHTRDVDEAPVFALELAYDYAKDNDYIDDWQKERFIK